MHKYKYFILFFSVVILLLVMYYFPISFDNNDDQAMFFINSGVLSGTSSPNLLHTNIIVGYFLKFLFSFSNHLNWYTLYLQAVQLISLLFIFYVLIYKNNINFLHSVLILSFLIFGFSVLCIVKVQYTIVALLSCGAALVCIQSELPVKFRHIIAVFFIILSILIRKDSFYIFIIFNVPLFISGFIKKEIDKSYLAMLALSAFLFLILGFINNNATYKKYETYKYIRVLDDVIDKPVKYKAEDLKTFGFTEDDMIMMSARYPASQAYCSGNNIIQLSEKIKSTRTKEQLLEEFKKFVSDERYMILVYLMSIIAIFFFSPKSYLIMLLNGIVLFALILYLASTIRIPHRVTFPLLIYVTLVNLYFFSKEDVKHNFKQILLTVFAILGIYKFYCTSKLIDMHNENHATFSSYCNEINKHPDYLFISLHDGFPVEFMNAWQQPDNLFTKNNLIMTGWNVWAPDFQNVLQHHQLKNITTDLKNKQNVVFLTNSQTYLQAFISVMKQRYNLTCRFEDVQEDFRFLHPKKLIFDN